MTTVDRIAQAIERATDAGYSRQPRLGGQTSSWGGWGSLLWPAFLAGSEPPMYLPDSRTRDAWLRQAWRQEPHLAGVVNSVVLIDANRGWTVTGGRNQILRYTNLLHGAEAGAGWRAFASKASLSFWTTDMGALVETGRGGRDGPLRALYNLDSARCRLTGDTEFPLEYFPALGDQQRWRSEDFFRACSLPSDDESYHGLGFCAVSRCIEVTRLLYAVLAHDQELVAARAPKGLLLLSGISEQQWEDSLSVREERLDSMERRYYAGVQVLASSGMETMDAKLVALSQLPANFDAKVFTDLSMYAYALAFGYDPSEFWPVQFGSLGRGREAEIQHQKASGKGNLSFALAMQEQLQAELPPTLEFEFEQRDDAGEMTAVAAQRAKLDVVRLAYESGLKEGAPLLSREEARQLLAEEGLIPEEWTAAQEDQTVTDTDDTDRALSRLRVREAMRQYPHEQIVRVSWPSGQMRILYDPHVRRAFAPAKWRQIDEPRIDELLESARRLRGERYAALLAADTRSQ